MKLLNKIKEKIINWTSALIVVTDPLTDKEKKEKEELNKRLK